jgi:hypothetical protein
MNEPDNLTGWVDKHGGTWVRVDDCPGQYDGTWWPRCDGPGFEPQAHDRIGQSRPWSRVDDTYGPFTAASPELIAETIELVRREWSR